MPGLEIPPISLADLAIAIPPLIFAIVKFSSVWRFIKHPEMLRTGTNWPALATWLFSLCLGIGLTFRIPAVRAVFEPWVGVFNLGWFLGFVFECTSLYVEAWGRLSVRRRPVPWYLHAYVAATFLVFGIIFVTDLAAGPERLEYPTAVSLSELVFMDAKYVCVLVMAFIIGESYYHLCRDESSEQKLLVRLRLGGLAITAFGVVAYASFRAGFVSLSYAWPACPGLRALRVLEQVSLRVVSFAWPLALLVSNRVIYSLVRKPVDLLRKPALREGLRVVHEEVSRPIASLNELFPQVQVHTIPMKQSTLLYQGSLDLQIYQLLIAILDAKRRLLCFLETETSKSSALYRHVESLLQMLQVDDTLDYYKLVEAYSTMGKKMLRE